MSSDLYNDLGVKTKKLTARVHYFEQGSNLHDYFEMSAKNWPFAESEPFLNAYVVDLKNILRYDSLNSILENLGELLKLMETYKDHPKKAEMNKVRNFFDKCQSRVKNEFFKMSAYSEEEKKRWKSDLISELRLSIEEEVYFWQEEIIKRQTPKS